MLSDCHRRIRCHHELHWGYQPGTQNKTAITAVWSSAIYLNHNHILPIFFFLSTKNLIDN
jgi:hypothetical protein